MADTAGRTFLDTNILVYAVDNRDPDKQRQAQSLLPEIANESLVISAQVLGEFYSTVTRKLSPPLSPEQALSAVERLSGLTVVALDYHLVTAAIELCNSSSISYWDALIVRAASSAGCQRLLTEDLNHGQRLDGVLVENPFREA